MKLKKIVSLAAAALMAVSMLTACGSNGTDNGGASSEETNTTNYSSVFESRLSEKAQLKIDFAPSTTLDAELKEAVGASTYLGILSTNIGTNSIYNLQDQRADWPEAVYIMDELEAYNGTAAAAFGDLIPTDTDDLNKTVRLVYATNGTVDANTAVKQVADELNRFFENLAVDNQNTENDTLRYTYTGSVSLVSKSIEDGHGMSVHVIAVEVTRTAHA